MMLQEKRNHVAVILDMLGLDILDHYDARVLNGPYVGNKIDWVAYIDRIVAVFDETKEIT